MSLAPAALGSVVAPTAALAGSGIQGDLVVLSMALAVALACPRNRNAPRTSSARLASTAAEVVLRQQVVVVHAYETTSFGPLVKEMLSKNTFAVPGLVTYRQECPDSPGRCGVVSAPTGMVMSL